jgi:hypothetical protein
MKNLLLSVSVLILPFFIISMVPPTDEGIRIKEQKPSSTVYEIRIQTQMSEAKAATLDLKFMDKQGILSVQTQSGTRICTVETDKTFPVYLIRQIIEKEGLVIAKTFE